MEFDWLNAGFLTLAGGAVAWAARMVRLAKADAAKRQSTRETSDLALIKHQDGLTFELLRAAHAQASAMRADLERVTKELSEIGELRWRIAYFEESISHIEALMKARVEGKTEAAEDAARKFLARVQAMNALTGNAANREQARRALEGMQPAVGQEGITDA